MAQVTFVSVSVPAAATTTAISTYPADIAAGDLLLLYVASDSAGISTTVPGFTQVGTIVSGGGVNVAVFQRTATGAETGNVTVNISGGTKGVTLMSARRPPAGKAASAVLFTGGTDTDATSTAYSATGASMVLLTDDVLAAFTLGAAPASTAFTGIFTGHGLTSPGATLGAGTGRVGGRTGTNTLAFVLYDKPVTAGSTGAPTFTATAAGANVTGATAFVDIRVTEPPTTAVANAGADQTVESLTTVTLNGGGTNTPDTWLWRQISGPTITLSSTTAQTPTFKAPATISGATIVLGLKAGVGSIPAGATEDTITVTVRPHIEWAITGGTTQPIQIHAL